MPTGRKVNRLSGQQTTSTKNGAMLIHDAPPGKRLAPTAIERGIQAYQRGNIDDAVEILLENLKLSPDHKPIYYCLCDLLINAKQYKDALDVINEMPQGDGDVKIIEMIGYCKEGMGLDQEALRHADHALSINNNSAAALNLKGLLSFKQNKIESAEDYFKKAIEADPGYGEPYTNLGAMLWNNKPDDALALFERGFILSPTTPDILSNYHSAITATGEFKRAIDLFEDACFLYPNCKIVRYRFIDVLLKLEKNEQAIDQIEKALVLCGVDDGILSAALKIREMLGPKEINEQMKKKNRVSLCMIVKNEEKHLAKCLESVKPVVGEMIVVDTGSTDRTRDIAKVFGAKVYDFKWCDDFSRARNFSLSKASGDWIFVLDADEVISSDDHATFRELVEKPFSSPLAYSFETKNYTMLANRVGWYANDGTYEEEAGIGWISSVKVRLFPNIPGVRFTYPVHELVDPRLSACGVSKRASVIPVHHYGKLNEEKRGNKGEAYYQIGVRKLDELGNDLFALRELAVQAGELERHEEAIELWGKVLSLQPDMPEALVNKGGAYWQTGQYEDALSCAKKAISLAPDLKEAHFNYAVSLLLLGRAMEAVSVLENLISREPEYLAAQFMLAASCCCCVGKKEQSLKYVSSLAATKLGPGLGAAFYDLAKRLLASRRVQYAQSVIEAALESEYRDNALLELLNECRLSQKTEDGRQWSETRN